MTTIRELINTLMTSEDLDEPVLFQYYTSEHFVHTGLDKEVWAQVVAEQETILIDDDNYSIIEHSITNLINQKIEIGYRQ